MSEDQLVRLDPSSYSNYQWVQTVAFHIDVTPDFDTHILRTILDLHVIVRQDGANVLSLDMSGQDVEGVELISGLKGVPANTRVKFEANAATCPLGQRFLITLPGNKEYKAGDELFFRITYFTSPKASALQTLPKEASKSGKYQYLYTQCQAIHARSLLIIQDACTSKVTFTATVRVKEEYGDVVALMSALEDGKPVVEEGHRVFNFKQPIPIPPYLYALVVGEIETAQVSERCFVHAEPAEIKVAAREYADMEISLKELEGLCGPYRWSTYSVLSAPMGFCYGGMESTNLSVMSSSLLPLPRLKLQKTACGSHCPHFDDSTDAPLGLATSVAIHEITHSWSGNLVTNESWCDFYLNEGLTMFCEWRTQRKLRGTAYESLHRLIGWEDLKDSITLFDELKLPHYTQLVVDLKGDIDPDDVFSSVPYMKGAAFFIYLEDVMGGAERFEDFLKKYFDAFSYKTVNSSQLKDFYLKYCNDNGYTERIAEIDWDTWFNKPGLPPVQPSVDMTLANDAYALADVITAEKVDIDAIKANDDWNVSKWSHTQQTVFLDRLNSIFDERFGKADAVKADIQNAYLTVTLPAVKALVDFGVSQNCELFSRWINLFIKSGASPDYVLTNEFDRDITLGESAKFLLSSVGRMKFLRPLFRYMLKAEKFQKLTAGIFEEYKHLYHTIASTMVEQDIKNAPNAVTY